MPGPIPDPIKDRAVNVRLIDLLRAA